jgi:hypothetical protein
MDAVVSWGVGGWRACGGDWGRWWEPRTLALITFKSSAVYLSPTNRWCGAEGGEGGEDRSSHTPNLAKIERKRNKGEGENQAFHFRPGGGGRADWLLGNLAVTPKVSPSDDDGS